MWYVTRAFISISFDFSDPNWLSKFHMAIASRQCPWMRIFSNVTMNSLMYKTKREDVYIIVQIKFYNILVGSIIFVLYKVKSQPCNPYDQSYLPCKLWYIFIGRVMSSEHFENSCISYWVDLSLPELHFWNTALFVILSKLAVLFSKYSHTGYME